VAGRCDLIVACGGDGTLCEVLNGMSASDTPVSFIPAGTGNDFVRTLGLPTTPCEAARQIVQGRSRRLDLMRLAEPSMAAINIIGIGFDAAVAARMNRQTRFGGGALSYLCAVMMELARMRPARLRLRVDEETWEGEALLVAIANAQTYGGGMRIAPEACVDDGLLDVVIVEPLSRLEFLKLLPRVFKGTHVQHPAVFCRRGREIVVESDVPVPVMVDGDLRAATPLRVTVEPGAAHLWLPRT
jgi:diacylglycerol kinase (ATP)